MQRNHISGDLGTWRRILCSSPSCFIASCDVWIWKPVICKTLEPSDLKCPHFDAGWPLVASTMRPKLCFFGMFWTICKGQVQSGAPMLQRYNTWCFDSYLLFVRASLVTDGSNLLSTIGKHLQRSEMKPFDFGRHRAYKCYIVVVPRPTREFATIGRVLTSAQAGVFVTASKY